MNSSRYNNTVGNGYRAGGGQWARNVSGGVGNTLQKPDWQYENLKPLKKDFYIVHPNVRARNAQEIELYRQEKQITVKGDKVPDPIQYFEEGNFPENVMQMINKFGFHEPTAIQAQGWPIAMSGYNMVGIGQTG